MAKSKDDIKYGTAQAKLSEDEALRVRYKHGTPLEAGKIADSEPVDLFSSAHNISKASNNSGSTQLESQSQLHPDQPAPNTASARQGNATSTNNH
ncbi:hypothetical protein Tsubulata_031076 [Turnera subulata]|uniref:Seed maturation protein n=1 Tax=Turnera subulata TaxID=218843 RepID=A0A9Q0FSG6_9ROSI|nr:hypothetical protein Tsubulata_031076 [Turnera subulata]